MYKAVVQRLGLNPHLMSNASTYKADFWYARDVEIKIQTPRSDDLEKAFGKVADSYVRLQENWFDEDDVEIIDEDDDIDQDEEEREVF
jgi:hypothetical protein